ncbi:hypothetical protein RhiirC2_861486 [Rhizophagus irregularis]|uniref:Tesmin/TSO1-like CXC domain-containing protein n=1 Tax=Rhizophagus irregularis TaxID=588596 RepID=A0A2N1MSQ8_9GLOM|nr:hypothetical protein RhiirC2_869178 [Rhizophagus irregularis]PKK78111.1 hypothetical protein RhiirC2_861486 [Rhizophagus irregularis]
MFGYSNKLRLGVMKRDILACLRDLKVMRETNSFDNILLNIWEKKFNKWLDELDNVQNVVTVTEAVRLQSNVNSVKCKCPNTNCSTMKCACKKLNLSCNIRCHPGKTCHNPSL